MRTRWVAVVLAVGALGLSGCSANRGTELVAELQERLDGVPGIESVAVGGSNSLPFIGSASGTIHLEDGIDIAQAAEVAEILAPYMAGEDSEYDLRLETDGVEMEIVEETGRNEAALALLEEVRQRTDLAGAVLGYSGGRRACLVEAEAAATSDLLLVYEALVEVRARSSDCAQVAMVLAQGRERQLADTVDRWDIAREPLPVTPISEEIAGLRTVLDRFQVQGYEVEPGAVDLRLSPGEDVAAADRLLRRSSDVQVSVSAGSIQGWSKDVPAPNLVAELAELGEVTTVQSNESGLYVGLVGLDTAEAVYQQVKAHPEAGQIDQLGLSGVDAAGGAFRIIGSLAQMADRVRAAPTLAAYAPFELGEKVSVSVDRDQIPGMAAAVKPLIGPGTLVAVRERQGVKVVFHADGNRIRVDDAYQRKEHEPLIEALQRAWAL